MNPDKDVQWFAAGGGIAKVGPFNSQVEAWEYLRLTEAAKARSDKLGLTHPADSRVWPERTKG